MNLIEAIRFTSSFAYALLPYSAIYILIRNRQRVLRWSDLLLSAVWGLVGFIVTAVPSSASDFNLYCILHAVISIPCVIWLCFRFKNHLRLSRPFPIVPAVLVGLALLVRVLPYLPHDNWLGSGDMRFHNILAKSIMVNNSLPDTWEPFASIPVNYPLGGHLIAAFISKHAMLPVHICLNASLCFYGALSVGLIYMLAMRIFDNRNSAIISTISYGFIALSGSLDYGHWGGMPNSLGMMLLLLLILEALRRPANDSPFTWRDAFPALISTAIVLTHHYSALAMFIFVGGLIIFSPLKAVTRKALLTSVLGALAAILLLQMCDLLPDITEGHTSVFVFEEQPLMLTDILMMLNPAFALLALGGLYLILRNRIPPMMSIVTAWVTAYFAAFIALEYCYRIAVFILTDGASLFTALTPSRLIADSAYPLSLAAGAIALHASFEVYRKHALAVLAALGLVSSLMFFLLMQNTAPIKGSAPAAEWIHANTPEDACIVGGFPHLEYLSWRRTSHPPLPASEARHSPELVRMRNFSYASQWQAYASENGIKCFFIFNTELSELPVGMTSLHSTGAISVCILEKQDE